MNNTISFYVNGNKDTASGTRSKNYTLGGNYRYVGAYRDSNHVSNARNPFYGYMSDIRVTTDSRYTSSFTVPGGGAVPGGANGFRLDFSDPSNLGADSSGGSNNWTVNNFVTVLGAGDYISELSNVTNGGDYTGRYRSAFDGNLATHSYGFNNDTITWTPTGGQAYTSARVYARGESGNLNGLKYKLVGGSETSITVTTSDAWYSLPANGTIEYIIGIDLELQTLLPLLYIEINVSILVDGSQSYNYDSFVDSPTNYVGTGNNGGNYCTLNENAKSSSVSLSNGALEASSSANAHHAALGTFALNSGKWYFEMQLKDGAAAPDVGWHKADYTQSELEGFNGGSRPGGFCIATDGNNNNIRTFNVCTMVQMSNTSWATGDVIGCAIDMDAKKIWFRKNNDSWYPATAGGASGNPATGSNPTIQYSHTGLLTPRTSAYGNNYRPIINFGARGSFSYAAPSGYESLCTQNLGNPLIEKPSENFDIGLYVGNGTTGQAVTGLDHQPGILWIKERSASGSNNVMDSIRGNTKIAITDVPNPEFTKTEFLDSFDSNGFTVDYNGVDSSVVSNRSGKTYVGWSWNVPNLATNSAYNQSDVWSDRCTGTVYSSSLGYKNAFDGLTSTSHSANGYTITFTPATAISVSSSIKIYYDIGSITGTSGSADITINGTSYVATAHSNRSNGHFTVTGVSSITSMVWERAADNDLIAVKAIEVDGKMLVDAGVVPVGSLNSSVYNQSQNWTNNVSSTSNISSGHEARLFNGILYGSNADIQSTQGTTGVINFTNAITGSKIEIFTIGNVGQIGINGLT